jgi:GT2 family glycosyltransferase
LTEQPSVAIVILNWNGSRYLRQFLPFVLATTYANRRIIVADNASTDDSIIYVQDHFPHVEVLSMSQNFGFAKGYNEALKNVQADYYVLLNSDVEVSPGWLEPIIELLEAEEKRAACQPKVLSYGDKKFFEYAGAAGGWIDSLGYPFARGRVFETCEEDMGQYNQVEEVFWTTGAAMVVKSRCFHQVGGFDDYFFAHMEEIDLCWRLQLAGFTLYSCPQSVVFHVGGGTLPQGASKKTFLNYRNNQIMLAKNLPFLEKCWKIPCRMALDQVAALKNLLSGDPGYLRAVVRAHLAFFYWVLFVPKRPVKRKRTLKYLSGVYNGNLIIDYFLRKKRFFREIVKNR